jgi:hypothetical protein
MCDLLSHPCGSEVASGVSSGVRDAQYRGGLASCQPAKLAHDVRVALRRFEGAHCPVMYRGKGGVLEVVGLELREVVEPRLIRADDCLPARRLWCTISTAVLVDQQPVRDVEQERAVGRPLRQGALERALSEVFRVLAVRETAGVPARQVCA